MVKSIAPPLHVVADTITREMLADAKFKAVGRDQIEVAIDARRLGLDRYDREDLIGLVCRKIVNHAANASRPKK